MSSMCGSSPVFNQKVLIDKDKFMSENINEKELKQSFSYLPAEAVGLESNPILLPFVGEQPSKGFGKVQENDSARRLRESALRVRRRLCRGREIF